MITVERGFPGKDRSKAANLFWEAFEGKLGLCMGPQAKALKFLEDQMRPMFAFSAYEDGKLLGLVGFKTDEGGLVGGDYKDLAQVYGYISAIWRGLALSMFERELSSNQLLLDGIFVAASARGKGVGTALLTAIEDFARYELRAEIRLDVIDTNTKARALYERVGYVASGKVNAGILKPVLGFSSATTMIKTL
jgi:GNAT superfamily N-acetyltransferase